MIAHPTISSSTVARWISGDPFTASSDKFSADLSKTLPPGTNYFSPSLNRPSPTHRVQSSLMFETPLYRPPYVSIVVILIVLALWGF